MRRAIPHHLVLPLTASLLGERFEECQQHQADHKQLAWRVAPIHGVPEAVAFGDKHRWIVGMVVQEASSNPVPTSIAEHRASFVHGTYHFMLPESVAQGHHRPLRPLTSSSSEELF